MEITICIGSSCHMKGSRLIIQRLEELIDEHQLKDKVQFKGAFCMGKCSHAGVSIRVNDQFYHLLPEDVDSFFQSNILSQV